MSSTRTLAWQVAEAVSYREKRRRVSATSIGKRLLQLRYRSMEVGRK